MRLNRRVPNGTHGGVRGRGLFSPSYSIGQEIFTEIHFFGFSAWFVTGLKIIDDKAKSEPISH